MRYVCRRIDAPRTAPRARSGRCEEGVLCQSHLILSEEPQEVARPGTSAYVSIAYAYVNIAYVISLYQEPQEVARPAAHPQYRPRLPQNAPVYACVCYPYADACYAYVSAIRMQELIRSIGHASPKTRLHTYPYAICILTCAIRMRADVCYT